MTLTMAYGTLVGKDRRMRGRRVLSSCSQILPLLLLLFFLPVAAAADDDDDASFVAWLSGEQHDAETDFIIDLLSNEFVAYSLFHRGVRENSYKKYEAGLKTFLLTMYARGSANYGPLHQGEKSK
mmetsp:Transcript_13068/g.32580  ORF Transcript_13068/g.32580 Transcript_13068/m.32580 type:complete len:125 (+) Transcript_13068:237-611(+)